MNIVSKFEVPSSNGLWFMIFCRFGGRGWLSDWINNRGVCRTAPATPGLLIIQMQYALWLQLSSPLGSGVSRTGPQQMDIATYRLNWGPIQWKYYIKWNSAMCHDFRFLTLTVKPKRLIKKIVTKLLIGQPLIGFKAIQVKPWWPRSSCFQFHFLLSLWSRFYGMVVFTGVQIY